MKIRESINHFVFLVISFVFIVLIIKLCIFFEKRWPSSPTSNNANGIDFSFIDSSFFIFSLFAFVFTFIIAYIEKNKKSNKKIVGSSLNGGKSCDKRKMRNKALEVLSAFQKDWSNGNINAIKNYSTDYFFNKKRLEARILDSYGRKNMVRSFIVFSFVHNIDSAPDRDHQNCFAVSFWGKFNSVLCDNNNNGKEVFNSSYFLEQWKFLQVGDEWMLDEIDRVSQTGLIPRPNLKKFADENGFYFTQEFLLLSRPDGFIFPKKECVKLIATNYVLGEFNGQIVEFYNFASGRGDFSIDSGGEYLVAQTALPKKYNDILLRKKLELNIKTGNPRGLRKIETESNDFNRKFELWADPRDHVNSFELLAPDFMEKVYNLPFNLNIEVTGNFLFLYLKDETFGDRNKIIENDKLEYYQKMLEILSRAFREMEK